VFSYKGENTAKQKVCFPQESMNNSEKKPGEQACGEEFGAVPENWCARKKFSYKRGEVIEGWKKEK